MTDEQYAELFNTYTPYVEGFRVQITEWISGGCEGEFPLRSIAVQVPPSFQSLSEYYYSITGELLHDFFEKIDSMFPDFTLGYRLTSTELSLYLTKS